MPNVNQVDVRDIKRGQMLEAEAEAKFKEAKQNNLLIKYLKVIR